MLRNVIKLSDGTRIESGADVKYAIQSCTITESVNSGTELTLGSTCCSCLEATIIDTAGDLSLAAGQLIKLYKADDSGNETLAGTFRLEMPTRKSESIYKITAYDLIADLDVDATQFLKEFDNWGCTLAEFADRLCDYCGLRFHNTDFPNCTFPVPQFYKSGVTGRQIMQWVAEIAGCFCRANASAEIELVWYTRPDTEVVISPTGDRYYFSGALTYEDYNVAAIDAVKLRLADGENGALWPDGNANNPYIITGNPILLAEVTENLLPYLNSISERLADMDTYKPCKVSLPAGMDIRPGHKVQVVDKHGNQFTTYVMTKTQSGQRDTLECTGSARRDSATATNNRTHQQLAAEQQAYADSAAQSAAKNAVSAQTQQDIFNKLTDNYTIQGIYAQDGKWYINASVAKIEQLKADDIVAGILRSKGGNTYFNLDTGAIVTDSITAEGGKIAGWTLKPHKLSKGEFGSTNYIGFYSSFPSGEDGNLDSSGASGNTHAKIGNVLSDNWRIIAGKNFGVTRDGQLAASNADISGTITATSGKIANWTISDKGYLEGSGGANTIRLYPKGKEYAGYTFYLVIYDSGGGVPVGGITETGWKTIAG